MIKVILIIGSGLLGKDMISVLRRDFGEAVGTYSTRQKEGSIRLDVTDRQGTMDAIAELRPAVIVHTAAQANVDYCEDHRAEALAVNADGTRNVVAAARSAGSKVVYISTDFVFDGAKGMYGEDDAVNPVSVYAYSKLLGEYYVKDSPGHIIARTSVVYGDARQNFVSWVRDSLAAGQKIRVFTDQFNSPTLSIDCAEAVSALITGGATGIFNTAGRERISRYEFARKIAAFYGLDDGLIEPITTGMLSQKARRPADSSLDVGKVGAYHKMLNIMEGLKKMEESRNIR
jgi:dTDP-4-dehydrorhamnose reductase